jgi:hypothetical protein
VPLPRKFVDKIPVPVLWVYFILTLPLYCLATCFILTFLSCLQPYIRSYLCKRDNKRRREKNRKEIIDHTPKILGLRKGRSLSIGKPEFPIETNITPTVGAPRDKWKTTTDEQANCGLFKLPYELRRQIFEEVVGGYMVHIYFMEKYLPMAHSRCKPAREGKCECPCFENGLWRAYQPRVKKQKGALDEWGQCELLAISKTCRRM